MSGVRNRRRRFRPMRRVPPSMLIREDLDRLLTGGAGPGENLISELVQTVTRLVVQQLLEAEQTDFVGDRGRYERRDPDASQRGWRNGYVESSIRTAEGKIPIRVPQVRDAEAPRRTGDWTAVCVRPRGCM